jgi:hypothetical protein
VLRAPPLGLGARHGAAEVACRALVAGGACLGQQPRAVMRPRVFLIISKMRSATQSVLWGRSGIVLSSPIAPARHRCTNRFTVLWSTPAEVCRPAIASELKMRVDNVHALPLRLQWPPPAVAGMGSHQHHRDPGGRPRGLRQIREWRLSSGHGWRHSHGQEHGLAQISSDQGVGHFLAMDGDFHMARDSC